MWPLESKSATNDDTCCSSAEVCGLTPPITTRWSLSGRIKNGVRSSDSEALPVHLPFWSNVAMYHCEPRPSWRVARILPSESTPNAVTINRSGNVVAGSTSKEGPFGRMTLKGACVTASLPFTRR